MGSQLRPRVITVIMAVNTKYQPSFNYTERPIKSSRVPTKRKLRDSAKGVNSPEHQSYQEELYKCCTMQPGNAIATTKYHLKKRGTKQKTRTLSVYPPKNGDKLIARTLSLSSCSSQLRQHPEWGKKRGVRLHSYQLVKPY